MAVSGVMSRLGRSNFKQLMMLTPETYKGLGICQQTYSKFKSPLFMNSSRYLSATQLNSSKEGNDDIRMSDSCAKRLNEIATNEKPYLRIAVEGGGCSGFQYKFDMDNNLNPDDRIFEKNGAKLVIDEVSLDYLKGSTVDYHEELIRSAFRIESNPKAEQGCSCGASFAVKID